MTACNAFAEYPDRPIRYIVPSAAGGSPDITARALTAELSRQMGQQFVVDNRPGGASGTIGTEMIARAAPDGYTIGQGLAPALAIMRTLLPKRAYNPELDLQPIVQVYFRPNLLAVAPSLPVKSVQELIDHAKKSPEVNKAIASPQVREKFTALGYEVVGGTPEQFAAHIKRETAKWADVVRRAGIKID